MELVVVVLAVLLAAALGVAAWLGMARSRGDAVLAGERGLRRQAEDEVARLRGLDAEKAQLAERCASLERRSSDELAHAESAWQQRVELEREVHAEKLASVERAREEIAKGLAAMHERMEQVFGKLAADALRSSQGQLLEFAKAQFEGQQKEAQADLEKRREAVEQLVRPIGETLAATRLKLDSLETARAESFAKLVQQIESVTGASAELRDETARLSRALSRPEIRGQYGEIQLRRVAELAGMTSFCDFCEQSSVRDGDGALLRPDMIVRLPNERVIAVDAKTNIHAYIEAASARDDAEREAHLERFARHVAEQAKKLGDKRYWSQYEGSPDFVVMFVPGDHFIDAALSRRPELIEAAAGYQVILASPSTLIGLLRAVAVGWREHKLAEEARELFELGRELHDRASVALDHASKLGDAIRMSVERYNKFVGSVETRLMPTLRRFEESGVSSGKELTEPVEVVTNTRMLGTTWTQADTR